MGEEEREAIREQMRSDHSEMRQLIAEFGRKNEKRSERLHERLDGIERDISEIRTTSAIQNSRNSNRIEAIESMRSEEAKLRRSLLLPVWAAVAAALVAGAVAVLRIGGAH